MKRQPQGDVDDLQGEVPPELHDAIYKRLQEAIPKALFCRETAFLGWSDAVKHFPRLVGREACWEASATRMTAIHHAGHSVVYVPAHLSIRQIMAVVEKKYALGRKIIGSESWRIYESTPVVLLETTGETNHFRLFSFRAVGRGKDYLTQTRELLGQSQGGKFALNGKFAAAGQLFRLDREAGGKGPLLDGVKLASSHWLQAARLCRPTLPQLLWWLSLYLLANKRWPLSEDGWYFTSSSGLQANHFLVVENNASRGEIEICEVDPSIGCLSHLGSILSLEV